MVKKYEIRVSLGIDETEQLLLNKGAEAGFYVKKHSGHLIIRKSAMFFNMAPYNFQISFIAQLCDIGEGTAIIGKFDAPKLFYRICACIYILFSGLFLFLAAKENSFLFEMLLILLLFGIFGAIVIKIFVWLGTIIFAEKNKAVLDFLQSIAAKYNVED